MPSLYLKLYKNKETWLKGNLENYLSEILCDILNRLSIDELKSFLANIISCGSSSGNLGDWVEANITQGVNWKTQYIIPNTINKNGGNSKCLDLVGMCNNKPFLVVENKINAAFNYSEETNENGAKLNQLQYYGSWLSNRNDCAILMLLTHNTQAPDDFIGTNDSYGIKQRCLVTWRQLAKGLPREPCENKGLNLLISEFLTFLGEMNMSYESPSFTDVVSVGMYELGPCYRFGRMMEEIRNSLEKKNTKGFKWRSEEKYIGRYLYRSEFDDGLVRSWVMLDSQHYAYLAWGIIYPDIKIPNFSVVDLPHIPFAYFGIHTTAVEAANMIRGQKEKESANWIWANEHSERSLIAMATITIDKLFYEGRNGGEAFQLWVEENFDKATIMMQKAGIFTSTS